MLFAVREPTGKYFVFHLIFFFYRFVLFGNIYYTDHPAHLVNFVACRAGCHERWDEFDPPHGPPRVLPEPPRWPLVDPVGPPDDCGCHGAQRFGHAPWFHAHDQPPIIFIILWPNRIYSLERNEGFFVLFFFLFLQSVEWRRKI